MRTITDGDRKAIWERMSSFEGLTVSQLRTQGSHHSVPVSRLSKEAKQRLEQLQLDDLSELWSFRVTSAKRFWCIKHENVYALLWWDPSHEVYPVTMRGT